MGSARAGGSALNELTTQGRLGRIRATAYAKLTLALRVSARRDDGYHELEAFTVSVTDPHDVVEAEAVPHPGGITFRLFGDTDDVPDDRGNLSYRAAEDLLLWAGRSGHGVVLSLRKKIPAGAGLGGASADAAATLVALRRMLEVEVDDDRLAQIAATLGSDVPFCLNGGAAWMTGRGEKLAGVDLPTGLPFLVAIPPFRLLTRDVYAAWDKLDGPNAARRVPAPPGPLESILPELLNDLEPAAEAVEPRLAPFRERLEEAARAPAIMAGSGSAYAVPLPSGVEHADLARRVSRKLRAPVVAATTASRGVRLGL